MKERDEEREGRGKIKERRKVENRWGGEREKRERKKKRERGLHLHLLHLHLHLLYLQPATH